MSPSQLRFQTPHFSIGNPSVTGTETGIQLDVIRNQGRGSTFNDKY